MEAVLWGRLENVRLLLKPGADQGLMCSRGGRALKAVDFARASAENDIERAKKSRPGEWHGPMAQNHMKMIPYLLDIHTVMVLTNAMIDTQN
ncbi:hypothetical protein ANO14919_057930 [Xylariales sp. No.14919]|nr:hypothetical protein ANO14919_057930 [Xylariales sp. No.14919]